MVTKKLTDAPKLVKTVEVEIDPATGLPALPEGHFWRVFERSVRIMKIDEEFGDWVAQERTVGMKPSQHMLDWAERFKRDGDYAEVETRYSTEKEDKRFFPKDYTTLYFRTKRIRAEFNDYYVENLPDGDVSPENLVEWATIVFLAWTADTVAKSLYGDYPPKKLSSS